MGYPTRLVVSPELQRRHGEKIDRLAHFLFEGDDLADAAARELAALAGPERASLLDRCLAGAGAAIKRPALRRFFESLDHVPFWVDSARCERGARVFAASGPLGFMVLFARLICGYRQPAANKPLMFTGRLRDRAWRRLAETGRFVNTVNQPDATQRHAEGFNNAVKVRLMHAHVRVMLSHSPRWHASDWGVAINQADMAATVLLFSWGVVAGLRDLGVRIAADEAEDVLHLWRYLGWIMGVREELLCTSSAEAAEVWHLFEHTHGPPDDDSRRLVAALLEPIPYEHKAAERALGRVQVGLSFAVARSLLGTKSADALGVPADSWRFALPALRLMTTSVSAFARVAPFAKQMQVYLGRAYWKRTSDLALAGQPASFQAS